MDKELRAGASRIVSLEEKLTQLLSEEKAAKLECEEQMSFAKELRVKKVEVELRVRELEDKRKQVAADMEREQKDLEARKAEACRMYETADERRRGPEGPDAARHRAGDAHARGVVLPRAEGTR